MKRYTQYSVEDLVLDDGFRAWVLNDPDANEAWWREWIATYPEMKTVVEEARQIVLGLQTKTTGVSNKEIDDNFREVEAYFDQSMQKQSRWITKGFWRIAASILALVVAGLGVLYQNQPSNEIQKHITRGGQQKKVQLPDGSRVYMKENSRLSYTMGWDEAQKRKVKLDGEAYFEVREQLYQGNKIKFMVKTTDVSVEVVGTEFVVNNRSSRTKVALNSGKIRLSVPEVNKALQMSPGDIVEYDASSKRLVSRKTKNETKSAWFKEFDSKDHIPGSKATNLKTRASETRGSGMDLDLIERSGNEKDLAKEKRNKVNREGRYAREQKGTHSNNPRQPLTGRIIMEAQQPVPNQKGNVQQTSGQNYFIHPADPKEDEKSDNAASVNQQGDKNNAYIRQIGDDLASRQDQEGSQNRATAKIEGSKGAGDELGWSTWQHQQGSDNVSIFNIVKSYNTNMYSDQRGMNNTVHATSDGRDNLGMVRQYGNQNQTIIFQDGDQNKAFVRQKGRGNLGMDPVSSGIKPEGRLNEVNIIQRGQGNRSRSIQRGNNNQIQVKQDAN